MVGVIPMACALALLLPKDAFNLELSVGETTDMDGASVLSLRASASSNVRSRTVVAPLLVELDM